MFKKICFSLFVLFCFNTALLAQEREITKGNKKFDQYAFVDSQKIFLAVAEGGYESADLFGKLADSFYYNADYDDASEWYAKLVEKFPEDVTPNQYFRYAQSLRAMEEYDSSDQMFKKYRELVDLQGEDYYNSSTITEIKNLNTLGSIEIEKLRSNAAGYSDFAPVYYGEKLLFSSTRDTGTLTTRVHSWNNQPFLDLYTASILDDKQTDNVSKLKGAVNTEFHESTAAVTADGNTIYFTRNNFTNGNYGTDKRNTNKLKLYKATRTSDGTFGNVQELPFNSDNYSTAHPALSPDEKTLYFASDREGTLGESDLWKVEITETGFGDIENLGPTINTPGRDTFPFVDKAGKLYFATDGRGGLGGLDIYIYDPEVKTITNFGPPINSPKDDFTLIYDSESNTGYFASNRSNDPLDDDIYKFVRTICKSNLIVQVIDADTKAPLNGAEIEIRDLDIVLVISGIAKAPDATFNFENPDCGKEYSVRAKMEGYDINQKNIKIPNQSSEVNLVIELKAKAPIDLGKFVNIYFDFDKSFIRPDAAAELDKIVNIMKKFPEIKIDVRSHTDSRGNDAYNLALSERRNKATIAYLIKKGISSDRLTGRGYGETQLLNECSNGVPCTEEQHQLNRRSEFIVQD